MPLGILKRNARTNLKQLSITRYLRNPENSYNQRFYYSIVSLLVVLEVN
jgi:hypothetical protein